MRKKIIIVGGGAAGVFAAVVCAEKAPHLDIVVLEKTRELLSKVKVSGGGRCNLTHAEFDPKKLVTYYPRGNKELLGPFHRFQPRDTWDWFENHGVQLKKEEDGRVFPATDCSATITRCLLDTAKENGVRILSERPVKSLHFLKEKQQYEVKIENHESALCDYLILATGGSSLGHQLASSLGHHIIDPVPSLFTFSIPDSPFIPLSGLTLPNVELSLPAFKQRQRGSLLLTHFGLSGPAALKLSAFAARDLYDCGYKTLLTINWVPELKKEAVFLQLQKRKQSHPLQALSHNPLFSLPTSLWKTLLKLSNLTENTPLGHVSDAKLQELASRLNCTELHIAGKAPNKAEFVTCGGVDLKEIDLKTMQSKLLPRLFFVGEILNIDGVTGGFNFQNAWTTAYLAASNIADN